MAEGYISQGIIEVKKGHVEVKANTISSGVQHEFTITDSNIKSTDTVLMAPVITGVNAAQTSWRVYKSDGSIIIYFLYSGSSPYTTSTTAVVGADYLIIR